MRFILFVFICISIVNAELYSVRVKKVDNNLYKTSDGFYIETKYCYEYASTSKDAILKYDRYSYDNKLIFDNGISLNNGSCEVKRVFK
ncbi:hypothetical protein [Campylobacter fetus]|uniref:Uncharacterized protein n=2 Tax=Campylobacter fetus TaxID=196 RepID=A0AAX0HBJ7_CAMFE|nr:hypothetical protein [Campylobacter fetus]AVK80573.1 hypothetical protein C6B32_01565 [Campylobacter fetus subsp. testudinum]EAK0826670.1 hypothetical protein [Campylobacter fetus]MPB72809.1 hypothetical protein [Campylobacter fetus]MPB76892.1 hypothetical protein [Campylobacter fetus]OCR85717.1 hypothetical protein CFT12S05168_03555 [Campylobacter fetus subsp. testudinum]